MEMDLSDIIMPFINEKLIPHIVREDNFTIQNGDELK
jgi:hypothetical protein